MLVCLMTLFSTHSLVTGLLGLFVLLMWREDREERENLWWSAALFLVCGGLALLAARGSHPLLAISLGNALTLWGTAAVWGGARVFNGRPVDWRVILAGGALWVVVFPWREIEIRLIGRCAISAAYCALLAFEFWSSAKERSFASRVATALVVAHGCFQLGAIAAIGWRMEAGGTFDASLFLELLPVEGVIHGVLIGFILLALSKERAVARQKRVAATDPLTGLFNRRSFDHKASQAIRNSRGRGDTALLVFDLDRLKIINDSFGHSMGDRALVTFGEVAERNIRVGDFLARVGGDEFALLLTRVDAARAVAVAERIRAAYLSAAAALGDGLSSVSVGIALFERESDLSALKEAADKALYAAKSGGRNQVFVAQS